MDVVEQYTNSKTGDVNTSEDGIVVTEDFVCVVDGVSSKTKTTWDGKTTGQIAKNLIIKAVQNLPVGADAVTAIHLLDASLTEWYKQKNVFDQMQKSTKERCSAAIIIYSRHHHQIWMIADCQALIDEKHITNPLLVDTLFELARAYIIELELLKGKTINQIQDKDVGREFIEPLLSEQQQFLNSTIESDFAYGALDGFFINDKLIKIVDVPKDSEFLVLASDGYPKLKSTLKESETALQDILAEDPLLFRKYKSTKGVATGNISYDDRAFIKIRLSA